jgi:large conductance mechanosensitive channel
MKKFLDEFKAFAMRGNVIDLAIGVVIGGAFGAIVNSLVGDILMPIIGAVTGGIDFSGLSIVVPSADKQTQAVIAYGKFIQATFVFAIVAFALFLVVKALNRMKKKEEAKPTAVAEVPEEVKLLTEIRDLLKK